MKNLSLFILLIYGQIVLAQDPYFINYSLKEGFPTATIYSANQDKNGFLWFTTDVGMVKYDSHKFELFNTDNGLSDNEVFQMKTDFKARTWLLTLNGKPSFIYKNKIYNEANSSLVKKVSGSSIIIDLYEDDQHLIYLVYRNGELGIIKPNNEVLKLKTEKSSIGGIWKYKEAIYMITGEGIYNSSTKKLIKPFDKQSFYKIYHTTYGNYLSDSNVLYKIESDNNFKPIITLPNQPEILNIHLENENKIWICARNGLYLIENNQLKKTFFKTYSISSIVKDFEGGYWVSTLKNGVLYVPSFDILTDKMGAENQLKLNCININKDKEIWIGGDNNNYFTKKSGQNFIKNTSFINPRKDLITNIRFYNNETYIIGKLGVLKIDRNQKKTDLKFSANDILIKNDQFYIGYTYTYKIPLNKIANTKSGYFNSKIILNKRGTVLSEGNNEDVWIGTNFGLYQYTQKDSIIYWGTKNRKFETSIEDLYYDETSQTLFVASNSKGIIVLKNNKIQHHITSASGLNSNSCNAIKKISSSHYLIATNNGLNELIFEKGTFKTQNLNALLGLKNNKINDIDYLDNIVYLATENGLIYFNLNNLFLKKIKPKCHLINLKNQNQTITSHFAFPYNKSDISIEFNGISYTNQGNLTYYYKLNDPYTSWSTSKETKINYKSLAPGNYVFSVYAMDDFGIKSNIKHIQFKILPPFWQKWWFIALVLLAIGLIIYLFIRYRLRRQQKSFDIEKQKIQLEKHMIELEQKALRMQMNPHFIFNALNTIKGYYTEGNLIDASTYISKFSKLLRKLLESEEQITTINNEIEMLRLYIELTQIRYENKFNYSIWVDSSINQSETLIPNLLLQPIVENAIIHGLGPKNNKGNLEISFKKDNQILECIVDDDGIGRKASELKQENRQYISKAMDITKERINLFDNSSTFEIIDKYIADKSIGTKVIIKIPIKEAL